MIMNRDKILELAREANLAYRYGAIPPLHAFERFAAIIEREEILSMRQPETNCYGDGNVYRGLRSKDSSKPTYVWPFIETVKGGEDGQE